MTINSNLELDDYDLLLSLKAKDENAFSHVYDKYAPCLYGFLLKQVQNAEIAIEILKKTFIKVRTECKAVDCLKQRLYAWLLSITHRVAANDFKINLSLPVPKTATIIHAVHSQDHYSNFFGSYSPIALRAY